MNPENFKIWMAGFYEGEGTIANDISNNNKLRMSVAQNDPSPLYMAQKVWGGSVRQRIRKSPASDKICIGYEWRICHNESKKFIEDIRQYMLVPYKIQQLENAIKISETKLDRRFKCKFCEETYASPSGRRRHEKQFHISKTQVKSD
jgi:hypothetical protein